MKGRKNMYELVKNENYYVVKGWMINDLKLKGNERIVFAVIYGFSQDGESWFEGSRDYLANWCNCTLPGLDKNIKSLLEKELIIKKTTGKGRGNYCKYKCNLTKIDEMRGFKPKEHNYSKSDNNKRQTRYY